MNPAPDSAFWLHLLAWLAGETAAALALTALAAWMLRSPAWRRTLWQAAFVALGLIVGAELTGAGRHVVQRLIAQPQPTRHFIVRGNLPVTVAPGQTADVAADPADALPPREATAIPAPPPPPARWWPGGLWLAGSGLLLTRFVAARVLLLVAGGRRRAVGDETLRQQVEAVRRRLGARRRVRLAECRGLRSPIAFGVLRPAIGLPARFRDAFPPAQRAAMLAHEMAHLAARDPLWHGLAEVVTAALWWQPLVWWARRQLHAASESAADEASLVVEDGPCALAECLVNLGKRLDRRRALVWLGVEGGGYRSGLGRRVERLLQLEGAAWRPVGSADKWILLVTPCVVAALTVAVAAWAAPQGDAEPSLVARVERALAESHQAGLPGDVAKIPADTNSTGPSNGETLTTPAKDGVPPAISKELLVSIDSHGNVRLGSNSQPVTVDQLEAEFTKRHQADPELRTAISTDKNAPWGVLLKVVDAVRKGNIEIVNPRAEWATPGLPTNSPARGNAAVQSNRLHATTLTQDGKLLYEMGKFDEAETKLRQAIQEDPENQPARYYLKRVEDSRSGGARSNTAPTTEHRSPPASASPSAASPALAPLRTRSYKVDPNTFLEGLRKALSSPSIPLPVSKPGTVLSPVVRDALQRNLRDFFTANGLDFSPATGKSVFYNERQGILMVRATLADLDKIESTMETLHTPPPQVNIQAKFVEVSASDDRALNFDWFLGNSLMGGRQTGVPGGTTGTNGTGTLFTAPAPISIPVTNASGVGTITGIRTDAQFSYVVSALQSVPGGTWQELRGDQFDWPGRAATNARNIRVTAGLVPDLPRIFTAPQYRAAIHILEQRAGTEILTLPQVTTLSGREAQVRATDLRTVLTGINPEAIVRPGTKAKDAPKSPTFFSASIACGPVLDVAPSVLPDGQTVNLALTASVTEFLGYDPPKRGDQVRVWQDGRRKLVARPTPRVRFRRMQGQARVFDGQTLVLLGPVVENRRLLVFVTPTIVDPAGKRVHSDDQLPSQGNAVPPQK